MTFIDYEKPFDKVDHGLLWQKPGQGKITWKVLRVMQNLNQESNACFRVNGETTDVFDCNIGIRQASGQLIPTSFHNFSE